MTASVKQEATPTFANTSGTTITVSLSNTVAGNALHAIVGANDGGGLTIASAVDTQGNTWSSYAKTADSGQLTVWQFVAPNIIGGTSSNTLVVTFNFNVSYRAAMMKEIQGVSTNPLDGTPIGNFQGAPGTGAGAITTGNAAYSATALLSSFAVAVFGTGTLVAVTGPGLSTQALGTSGIGASGSQRVTGSGTGSATFTQSVAAGTIAMLAVFDELVASTGRNSSQMMQGMGS